MEKITVEVSDLADNSEIFEKVFGVSFREFMEWPTSKKDYWSHIYDSGKPIRISTDPKIAKLQKAYFNV